MRNPNIDWDEVTRLVRKRQANASLTSDEHKFLWSALERMTPYERSLYFIDTSTTSIEDFFKNRGVSFGEKGDNAPRITQVQKRHISLIGGR